MRPFASSVSSCGSTVIFELRGSTFRRLEHPLEYAYRELSSYNRRDAQAALGGLGQLVDTRQQQPMQRLGDLDVDDRLVGQPAIALADDRAALDEHADHLFDEERVALGAS